MGNLYKSDSYQRILDKAKHLFLKHGIQRVTVQEICHVAGVSKMTFYRNYTNKAEIAEKVLFEIADESLKGYRNIMHQEIPFASRIKEMLDWKQNETNTFSEEFIKDVLNPKEPDLKILFEKIQKEQTDELLDDLKQAKKEGAIRKDVNLNLVIYMMNEIHDKMRDENFTSMFDDIKEAGIALTKLIFNGILTNNNQIHIQ